MNHEERKQAAKEYAQTHRPMGIFQLRNKQSGKLFVGSTMDLDGMRNRLQFTLTMGVHTGKELQKDWKELGEEAFVYEVLDQIKPAEETVTSTQELAKYKDELAVMEELWLEKLQPYGDRGYNKPKKA